MKKLVVLEPLSVPDDVLEGMFQEKLGGQVEWTLYDKRATSDEEMIERAKDAEIVVIANQPMSANVMEHLDKIECLAVAFTGFDHIPMDVCKAKGVTVCNASGYSNEAVTDLVFGMTITLLRNIRECDKVVREGGTMEWVDGNIGSKATMKYPACILAEPYAKASTMSLGFAGKGQYQDTGAKMIHLAPHTSSTIVAKSISRGGGRSAYRGLVKIVKGAEGSSNSTVCDALLVDEFSRSDTYPHVDVREDDVSMAHEATVSKVSEDQLFYLMSRGLSEDEAMGMIVRGFVEPISRELPMEYALELNRLVELQMEGSVG